VIDPTGHEFIYGDCFEWLKRLGKKARTFDAVLLDPPTFSKSKTSGIFRVEKDYGRLLDAALPLLAPGGLLFCSTNSATLAAEDFVASLQRAIVAAGREIEKELFVPQPPDFAPANAGPGYLKTVWLKVI
jgi:23S rRNA (cytosine1962-C5)-methyltransferase